MGLIWVLIFYGKVKFTSLHIYTRENVKSSFSHTILKTKKGSLYKASFVIKISSYEVVCPFPLAMYMYADDQFKQTLFQQSRGYNSNDPIWPVFELAWDFVHVHLICKFQEHPIKAEWVTLMTKSNRSFFSSQGDITLKINYLIWPVFELVRNFIHVHLKWKFQEDLIKTEWLMLMTVKQKFFSNQEDVTLRLMIRFGQFSYLSEILSMSSLSASFWNIQSKLNDLCWWQSNRLFQQSRGCNSNDPIWPVFILVRDFIHVLLICKFQEHLIKTEWLILMTKSNRCFFRNQGDVTPRLMLGSD